ncbi:molybdenum cofactor guanylyltransferase MobA [Ferrimonas balearica]|uniref:molybdenum cofactor guanylyltransferase MobA n=1 Tax=Ferrimonas balearica TaxID=44012 RepID=UPI001F3F0210|nr:molybdenum cofactor guanylyltransferase MobA [Ferrimonas balearica]MBY6019259.1 molybdenum cofactor guanylyltransferase [Halomonas denitrificans]MBY6095862.1 molybdenum cofactor guanylyltransferase [Ferrimonas balearica]
MTLNDITLAVLAGGQARRMGGDDKGLIPVAGQPMIRHVLNRVQQPGMTTMIIANRNQQQYAELGLPVHADELPGFMGPMAGMAVAMSRATTPLVLICPCDTPKLPADLAHRLLTALEAEEADAAVACDDEREHPVVILLKRELLGSIEQFLAAGDRKIDLWYGQHKVARCVFHGAADAFANINTPEQRQELEQQLLP